MKAQNDQATQDRDEEAEEVEEVVSYAEMGLRMSLLDARGRPAFAKALRSPGARAPRLPP